MLNETFQFIRSNNDIITPISGFIFGLVPLAVAIWIAYYSPQARQAKIEKKKYLLEKRNEHYLRLDRDFFKPFSNSLFLRRDEPSNSELELLKIDFIPMIASQFEKGINHLKSDFSDFPTEFKNLQEEVDKYNSSLDTFYKSLDSVIRTEFDGVLELNETYVFEQDYYILGIKPVKEVLLVLFSQYLNKISRYDRKLIQDCCKSAIRSWRSRNANVSLDGKEPFQLFRHSVTNLHFQPLNNVNNPDNADEGIAQNFFETKKSDDQKKQLIIDHICAITSDEEIFEKFKQINSMREKILKIEKKITDDIKLISESINKGDYETIAECCTDNKFLV